MNEFIKMGIRFTIAFLLLWLIMLTRGYDYFISWKDVMIALMIFLWIISLTGYFVFQTNSNKLKEELGE